MRDLGTLKMPALREAHSVSFVRFERPRKQMRNRRHSLGVSIRSRLGSARRGQALPYAICARIARFITILLAVALPG